MKLAEALITRANLQKRNAEITDIIISQARTQEDEKIPVDPKKLLAEYEKNADELCALIGRINKANAATPFLTGTIGDALAKKDMLTAKISAMRRIYDAATERENRYSRTEVRYVCNIDAAALRDRIDALSKELRELDMKLQGENWAVELP